MDRGAVLITGASSGIGRAAALHLDRLGFRVIAGVRNEQDAASLRQAASSRLTHVFIDVTEADSIAAAARRVDELAPDGLAGLVNNAGIAMTGPLEFIELDRVRRQMEINFLGQIAVTQAMLPAIRRRTGRIVNISSMSGRVASPFYGPYSASKHALEAMSDALRGELAPWGIDVVVVEPGSIDTPIWEKGYELSEEAINALPEAGRTLYADTLRAGLNSIDRQARRGISADVVAETIGTALLADRPKVRYVIGRDARIATLARRLLPDRLLDRLLWRRMKLPGRNAYRRGDE